MRGAPSDQAGDAGRISRVFGSDPLRRRGGVGLDREVQAGRAEAPGQRRQFRRQGRLALPVTKVGKAATFALMWGFPLLLLGSVEGVVGEVLTMAGWACALWGTWLYWWAGFDYVRQATRRPSGATDPE